MIMQNNKTTYLILISLFVLFKYWYSLSATDDLLLFLQPTSRLIELLTGSEAIYDSAMGYSYQALKIIIDKSCSGFNFWLLCFTMLSFMLVAYVHKPLIKMSLIPITMFIAWGITIMANTSRIYTAIVLESKVEHFFQVSSQITHEAIGVTTNLSFLVFTYLLTEKLIKTYSYAKFS